ncbi:cilia- and flagella-associated protein 77-like isoform X2 [Pecten maximus]|uniref:cilia- and flagella-associated protein 77-like isoform X2 n=1 Tax=Pecten maximus TaxID=6579 RepID=UPI001457FEE7|nr:cilia- and flagella-associated protein 77-like isoform X2 [Pecten maximus]
MAAEILSMNPFAYTATGELGENRDTMLSNELLLRTQLGRPKRRGYSSAPAEHFVYGRPLEPRQGGADDALHGWPPMNPLAATTLPFSRKEKKTDRDFMVLNKAAVQAGLVTASENYKFRATHDVRRKTAGDENTRSRTRRIPPTMVFGISTRPSTPIFDLLEHKYQDKWLMSRRQMELTKRQEESKSASTRSAGFSSTQRRNPNTVYETRASLLRTYQNPVDEAPLWQLPKFKKNARASLQTFRSEGVRKQGYEHFESDQISRKGQLGHGVFESAKN